MSFRLIYEHEPVSARGQSRIGGDDGLYRIKVSKKYDNGRKEFHHYLDGEYDKKSALLLVSEKNSQKNSA